MTKKRKRNQRGSGGRVTPKGTGTGGRSNEAVAGDSFEAGPPFPAGLDGTAESNPADPAASTNTAGPTSSSVDSLSLPGLDKPAAPVPALVAEIRDCLDEAVPHRLLTYGSVHAEVFDHRRLTAEEQADAGVLDPSDLYESLAYSGHVETLALLAVLGELAIDDESRDLARWMLGESGQADSVPEWIRSLDLARVTGALKVGDAADAAGAGSDPHVDILVGLELVGGQELVMVSVMDHAQGGGLVDSMVGPGTLAMLDPRNAMVRQQAGIDEALPVTDINLANAANELHRGITRGADLAPLPVTETWPLQRPLLEWILRQM